MRDDEMFLHFPVPSVAREGKAGIKLLPRVTDTPSTNSPIGKLEREGIWGNTNCQQKMSG